MLVRPSLDHIDFTGLRVLMIAAQLLSMSFQTPLESGRTSTQRFSQQRGRRLVIEHHVHRKRLIRKYYGIDRRQGISKQDSHGYKERYCNNMLK